MSDYIKEKDVRTLGQKIREYFKYPNNPLTTKASWFHILRFRLGMLNPFYAKDRWFSNFYHVIYGYYLDWEWLRYHTDMAFRLDKKIDKVITKYISLR